jgi:hypothetical protein
MHTGRRAVGKYLADSGTPNEAGGRDFVPAFFMRVTRMCLAHPRDKLDR